MNTKDRPWGCLTSEERRHGNKRQINHTNTHPKGARKEGEQERIQESACSAAVHKRQHADAHEKKIFTTTAKLVAHKKKIKNTKALAFFWRLITYPWPPRRGGRRREARWRRRRRRDDAGTPLPVVSGSPRRRWRRPSLRRKKTRPRTYARSAARPIQRPQERRTAAATRRRSRLASCWWLDRSLPAAGSSRPDAWRSSIALARRQWRQARGGSGRQQARTAGGRRRSRSEEASWTDRRAIRWSARSSRNAPS